MKDTKRVGYIDVYRGLGILFMVMGHVGFGTKFDYWVHAFHMPMWFIVSGYFFTGKETGRAYIRKKIMQLLVPYFSFGVGYYILWILMKRDAPLYEPLLHLALINTDGLPISGVLWFFTCLLWMEIICFFLFKIDNEKKRNIICAIIVVLAYLLNSILHIRLPWASDVAIISIPFFMFGYYSNPVNGKKCIARLFELDVMKTIAGILVGTLLIFVNGYVNLRTAHYGNLFLFYFDALLLSIAIMNISRWIDCHTKNIVSTWIGDYLKRIGKNSVIYLCTNQVIIMAINMILLKLVMAEIKSYSINNAILVLIGTLLIEELMVVLFSKTRLRIFIGRKKKE